MAIQETNHYPPYYRIPMDALEQMEKLNSPQEREATLLALFLNIKTILKENDIPFNEELSSYRIKSLCSINEKIRRRGVTDPILDLDAMQFLY